MTGRYRLNNVAAVLPIFGALLIVPPLVTIFAGPVRFFNAPLIVVYLFSVWLFLVLATLALSRGLRVQETPAPNSETDAADGTGAAPD